MRTVNRVYSESGKWFDAPILEQVRAILGQVAPRGLGRRCAPSAARIGVLRPPRPVRAAKKCHALARCQGARASDPRRSVDRLTAARARVEAAKRGLGERGTPWWSRTPTPAANAGPQPWTSSTLRRSSRHALRGRTHHVPAGRRRVRCRPHRAARPRGETAAPGANEMNAPSGLRRRAPHDHQCWQPGHHQVSRPCGVRAASAKAIGVAQRRQGRRARPYTQCRGERRPVVFCDGL